MDEAFDYDVRVDYDDQPMDIADKFVDALAKYGIKVEYVTPEDDDRPFMHYKIHIKKD